MGGGLVGILFEETLTLSEGTVGTRRLSRDSI